MRVLAIIVFSLVFAGCVSTHAFIPPGQVVDFKKYEKMKLEVQDDVHTAYSREGASLFKGLLKGQLESMGYEIVDQDPDAILNLRIITFTPGSKALRVLIAFGAGKAELTYLATVRSLSGETIAQLSGGKSYHGMELTDDQLFSSKERTRVDMIEKSVSQLTQFIRSNGRMD